MDLWWRDVVAQGGRYNELGDRLAAVWLSNPAKQVQTRTAPKVQVRVRGWGWTEPILEVRVQQ
jgi:hypothetical protein